VAWREPAPTPVARNPSDVVAMTADTEALETEAPEADTRAASRMWRRGAWLITALLVMFVVVPTKYLVLHAIVLYQAVDLVALGMVLYGVRRYRPRKPAAWLLIAGGIAFTTAGDLLFGFHEVANTYPFPSTPDIFYLTAYPLYAAGLLVASKARAREGERGTFIDAGIITINAALLASLFVASQVAEDEELTVAGVIVATAYPLADVLLVAVAVRFLFYVRTRPPSLRMLTLGLAFILTGDFVYSLQGLFTAQGEGRAVADTLLLGGVATIGLAGLHPTMTELTAKPDGFAATRYSVNRVVTLYLISLLPVVVLAIQALTGNTQHLWITLVALVAVASLVINRFIDLVGRTMRSADRGATLSELGSDLLATAVREDLFAAAERAAVRLVPEGNARVLQAGVDLTDGRDLYTAPVEVDGHVVATVVADERRTVESGAYDVLDTVARGLALALERANLLAEQRAAADNLAEQNAQLVELDRMKDQLVSSVSHELRTPLTSIGGYAEMLLDDEFGELSDEQKEFVGVIHRNSRRLNRIIDDILFAAKVDAGKLSLERTWLDLIEVATACVTAARPRAEKGQVSVELVAPDSLEPMFADHTRLTQMFDNLISNAVKFTLPGGTVTVTLSEGGDRVKASVADTGIGIPAGEVDRLFEKFFRTSTVGAVDGTGLGLSIVKSIVEVHDGSIAVSSIEGAGTTFTVDLPYRPTALHEKEVYR
jgi:signal transduction histidine kinase